MMLDHPALPWLALALGLCLVPVYGLHGDVDRHPDAAVVDGSQAYIAEEIKEPVLNASNGYEDDAIAITHRHVDAITLRGWANNTADSPRFTFPEEAFTLEAGTSATVPIQDSDASHPSGNYTVEAALEIDAREGQTTVGRQTMQRTLTVVVE